ncbi:unnamed protein product [Echinostoma caproni]|uniref:PHB domain-containing protein n=1 Tax=Echinostoma caproni TaxID=27848 RepID=A0A183ABZ1_9TREM|nr:unnamed protein product [Echinostoma caproni]
MHQIESGELHSELTEKEQEIRKRDLPSPHMTTVHPAPTKIDPVDLEPDDHGACGYIVLILAVIFYILLFPILVFFSFRVIQSYERGVRLRLGKLRKHKGSTVMGSGIQFVLPCIDVVQKVDMRTISQSIPPQEVLTKDSVTVTVDAIVYMRVVEPASAILRVENWRLSTQMLAVSTLRSVLGNYDLSSLLTCRAQIDSYLRQHLDEATHEWGIKVERVEIKDVSLPQEMQRAMAAEAQATRAANAKVIAAKGELDSAQMLQQAAQTMSSAPAALQLRYLQTLATIATEQNSTIIFPLPIELMAAFTSKLAGSHGPSK